MRSTVTNRFAKNSVDVPKTIGQAFVAHSLANPVGLLVFSFAFCSAAIFNCLPSTLAVIVAAALCSVCGALLSYGNFSIWTRVRGVASLAAIALGTLVGLTVIGIIGVGLAIAYLPSSIAVTWNPVPRNITSGF
jgi:hypothetical protein